LYGRQVEVTFLDKIRDEQKFDGLPALKAAIEQDIAAVRLLSERQQ
jgi:riboflavin kinase/FMN adenylyltransferase